MNLHSSLTSSPLFPTTPFTAKVDDLVLNESLASWLFRFRVRNGFLRLKDIFVGEKTYRCLRPLTDCPVSFDGYTDTIAAAAWTQPHAVQRLMLDDKLMGLKSSFLQFSGQWVLYSRQKGKLNSAMRHVICPLCVVEAPEALWMQSWRLTLTTQCRIHKVLLLEHCPECHAQFLIHNKRDCPLDRCESCFLPFSKMPVEACDESFIAPEFALNVGQNNAKALPVSQAAEHHWWSGVSKILTLIEDPNRSRQLARTVLPPEFAELLSDITNCPRQFFDHWPIRRRHHGLRFVAWITARWPERFYSLLENIDRSYRRLQFLTTDGSPWTHLALNEYSKRLKRPFPPLVSPKRDLLCRRTSNAYAATVPFRRNVSKPRASNSLQLRWSLDHTARIVQMFDARVWAMRGGAKTKARFLQSALNIIHGRGASALSAVDRDVNDLDLPAVQARQTVDAWRTCLRGLLNHVGSHLDLDAKDVPLACASPTHISKWQAGWQPPAQAVLFRWVDQGSSSQPTVAS